MRRLQVPRPLVATGRIQTGPHSHLREGHFSAGECPTYERCGILTLTSRASHLPLSHRCRKYRAWKIPRRRLSVLLKLHELHHAVITLVHDGYPPDLSLVAHAAPAQPLTLSSIAHFEI